MTKKHPSNIGAKAKPRLSKGCCFSRSSNDEPQQSLHASPTIGERQDDALSTHPADRQTSQQASSNSIRGPSRRRRQGVALPLDQHYNQPIRPHEWHSKRRLWTRSQIDREREEFFDTRVSGRAEVWAALRTTLDLLREGDVTTAQGIIDAAGITVPTGDLCEGCYDENGVLYRLPQCIVSDPDNIADDSSGAVGDPNDEAEDDDLDDGLSDHKVAPGESEEELIAEGVDRRREEKGKMSERDMIKVHARLSDRGGPDVVVALGKTQSVGVLTRKIENEINVGVSFPYPRCERSAS